MQILLWPCSMYRSNSSLPWTLEERKEGEEGEEDIWVVEKRELVGQWMVRKQVKQLCHCVSVAEWHTRSCLPAVHLDRCLSP